MNNRPVDKIVSLFGQISAIPRGTGREAALSAWLQAWAEARGYAAKTDSAGNLLIRVPASPGCESAPILILQGGQDFDVPAHITRDVVRRLRDADSTVEYVEAEELDHFSIVPWSRERILNWFAQRRSEPGDG